MISDGIGPIARLRVQYRVWRAFRNGRLRSLWGVLRGEQVTPGRRYWRTLKAPPGYQTTAASTGSCESCRAAPSAVRVSFVGTTRPSSAKLCQGCCNREMEHYCVMGKPGQVSLTPLVIGE